MQRLFIFALFLLHFASAPRPKRSLYSRKFPTTTQEKRLVVSLVTQFRGMVLYCSGTLLSDRLVLTAAHCLYRKQLGLASQVRVRSEGWLLHSNQFMIRADWMFLKNMNESICADVGLVVLPGRVPGFGGPLAVKFARISPSDLVDNGTEVFALGYGMTETAVMSVFPLKVPMAKPTADPQSCSLGFRFAKGAISCSGDSGGPVLLYSKHHANVVTAFGRAPIFLGLVSQIEFYPDKCKNCAAFEEEEESGEGDPIPMRKAVEDCKRASRLLVVHTAHIQTWLRGLILTERRPEVKGLYAQGLNVLIGEK